MMAEPQQVLEGSFIITGNIEVLGDVKNPALDTATTTIETIRGEVQMVRGQIADQLSAMADDGIITPTEKTAIRYTWDGIYAEYPIILSHATDKGIGSGDITDYTNAYTALRTYLFSEPAILLDLSQSTAIDRTTYIATFGYYTQQRESILSLIDGINVTMLYEMRYKRSATAPAAPTVADPADWYVAPAAGTDPLWVSGVLKNHDGSLAGLWSTPQAFAGASTWYSYHDNAPTSAPATPTGDGTAGGWHVAETSASVWVSVKTSVLRGDTGTWSTPAVRPGIALLPTYAPRYLGPGKLAATATAAFRSDTISAAGVATTGSNITPNPGDWMYNYDLGSVATLSVFRWSGTAWETSTVTWEHWIAATEDIGRWIKGAADAATRTTRTPASWTFFDTIFSNEAFLDRLAVRLIRSSSYVAGSAGMSIDLNSAVMQAENGKWKIDGATGIITAFDLRAYGIDFESIDMGDYAASPAEQGYGTDGALDGGDYVTGSFEPDMAVDGGEFMGG